MATAERKLKSCRGATMLLALVFFLLCTVMASILLAASSANSGRLSRLAENDKRYYAVHSAAELLKDGIGNKPVTVKLTKKTVNTTVTGYSVNAAGGTLIQSPEITRREYYGAMFYAPDYEESPALRGVSLLTDLALDLAAGEGAADAKRAWSYAGLSLPVTRELTVEPDFGEGLTVKVEAMLEKDGQLTLKLSNPAEGADSYNLLLRFGAELQRESTVSSSEGAPQVEKSSATAYTETLVEETIETKVVTVCWRLTGIEGVSS